MDSRVASTRAVGEAIARAAPPARACGCRRAPRRSTRTASTRRTTRRPADSAAASPTRPTPGTSASTSRRPGSARSTEAETPATRKVALRSAMTMSPDRGRHLRHAARPRAPRARRARRRRTAVRLVDPRARTSSRAVRFLIGRDDIAGAGQPRRARTRCRTREFMRALREAWGVRVGLPAPGVDARDRRVLPAHRDGAGPQEPARRARPAARAGFPFRLPARGPRPRGSCARTRVDSLADRAA